MRFINIKHHSHLHFLGNHLKPTISLLTLQFKRYMSSKSGVYCGPLKLLAVEVFNKCNSRGTPCDLVTGEDRKWASPEGEPSSHVSCTVEMTNISQTYEVYSPK